MRATDLSLGLLRRSWDAQLQRQAYDLAYAMTALSKVADAPETAQALVGTLYASSGGWVLLRVPNALGRGAFDALDAAGAELPKNDLGLYNAHISVMRPDEVEKIGGVDKITERGHQFTYTLGPVKTVRPDGWHGIERVWFIDVHSPALSALRRSYGLSSLPNEDKYRFHITFGVKKSKVLQRNGPSKAAA